MSDTSNEVIEALCTDLLKLDVAYKVPTCEEAAHALSTLAAERDALRAALERREEYCVKCGAPRSNHPYRHPFEARPTVEMGGVRVRELEWTWHPVPSVWQARSMVGVYEVDTHGSWRLTREGVSGWVMRGGKEAAEADHRRRILAVIESAPSVREAALEKIEASLRHIESCLIFPVSTEINKRGYDTRSPTPETVEYMVDEVRTAKATLRAIAEGKDDE